MMENVRLISLPKILDERGNLSFFESEKHIPFKIERVYWIYDVPGGEVRGGHSYKKNQEVIVALSGSFDIVLNDGKAIKTFSLNRSYNGLYIPSGVWRHMENFSTNSLAFIASATKYSEEDYVRDFNVYCDGNT
jgi:oxalate decarboxylase/phosphoglucose isomerase-like protein (cupin superfamily)